MSDSTQTPFGFRIRRVDEPPRAADEAGSTGQRHDAPARGRRQEPVPPSPEAIQAPWSTPVGESLPAARWATGACFPTPARALAFVSTLAGSGLADEVACRRGAAGGWWVQADQPTADLTHLMWTAGGRPYARLVEPESAGRWQEIRLDGTAGNRILDADAWPQIELAQILAGTGLQRQPPASAATLYLVVPPVLSRWALKRALAQGMRVGMRSACARPLGEEAPVASLLVLRIEATVGEVPRALARALAALPYATLAQSVGADEGRCLVDIAYRSPLAAGLLGELIPHGAIWLLGGPEIGHRALILDGEELDAGELLEAPALCPPASLPGLPPVRSLGTPLPVRLVPSGGRRSPVDALLLDDTDLAWTRSVLMGRPLAERALLLPGPGRHLLLAGGSLGADLPFGTPLSVVTPGGLLLECGLTFRPALPEGARRKVLELDPERVLVLTAAGAWRFALDHLVPAWTLWVGESPPVESGLNDRARAVLSALDDEQRCRETARESTARRLLEALRGKLGGRRGGQESEPQALRAEAIRAQHAGDFVRAAELHTTVGDLAEAGRLYELAAAKLR